MKYGAYVLYIVDIGDELFSNNQIGKYQYLDMFNFLIENGLVKIEIEELEEQYRVTNKIWSYISNCYKSIDDFADSELEVTESIIERIMCLN